MIFLEPSPLPLVLAQAGSAVADTIVTLQGSPGGLQKAVSLMTSIASIIIALALIAIAIPLIPAAWNSRKLYRRVNALLSRVESDIAPVLHHAHLAIENVNYVTAVVRSDVQKVNHLVSDTTERLEAASRGAERRMREFDALLRVMQEEAEELFVGSASAARGVRSGLAHLSAPDEPSHHESGPLEIRVRRSTPPSDF